MYAFAAPEFQPPPDRLKGRRASEEKQEQEDDAAAAEEEEGRRPAAFKQGEEAAEMFLAFLDGLRVPMEIILLSKKYFYSLRS